MRLPTGGDSGSQTGSRTVPSGGFLCGFNIVGCLGLLHEAGQVVGLRGRRAYRAVSLGLKSHGTPMPPFFLVEGLYFFSREKYGVFKP